MATPTGECEPRPVTCQTDADCPEGLTCVERSDGGDGVACTGPAPGTDGEVVCEEPEPSEPVRECTFAPVDCESDADCTALGFECLSIEEGGGVSCTGSVPTCAPGEDCPPPEQECEVEPTLAVSYCFPARQDCATDAECRGTWQCTDLPTAPSATPPTAGRALPASVCPRAWPWPSPASSSWATATSARALRAPAGLVLLACAAVLARRRART
ncbi:MAG: hypothetical protein PVI30_26095 [Myxococcales bacterium]